MDGNFFKKTFQKPLDILGSVWYNIDIKGEHPNKGDQKMKRTFTVYGIEYTVESCTAIAASIGDIKRQNALYVFCTTDSGEIVEHVVFSWDMPESDEDFADICDDHYAWVSDHETLATVIK